MVVLKEPIILSLKKKRIHMKSTLSHESLNVIKCSFVFNSLKVLTEKKGSEILVRLRIDIQDSEMAVNAGDLGGKRK